LRGAALVYVQMSKEDKLPWQLTICCCLFDSVYSSDLPCWPGTNLPGKFVYSFVPTTLLVTSQPQRIQQRVSFKHHFRFVSFILMTRKYAAKLFPERNMPRMYVVESVVRVLFTRNRILKYWKYFIPFRNNNKSQCTKHRITISLYKCCNRYLILFRVKYAGRRTWDFPAGM
jgi:hypothetical protein